MTCQSVKKLQFGGEEVEFTAVYGGSPEDNTYAKATPSGSLKLFVDNDAAKGAFEPGKAYYVDITPAD